MGYNEYFEYDITINNLSEEEESWLKYHTSEQLNLYDIEINDELLKEYTYLDCVQSFFNNEDELYPAFKLTFSKKKDARSVVLFGGEYGREEGHRQLSRFLQAFMEKFRPTEEVAFRWIRWDNRGKGTYDGGAYLISGKMVESINLKSWVFEKLQRSKRY